MANSDHNRQLCEVCKLHLHSINTALFGDHFICRECNMLLRPLLDSIANGIIARAQIDTTISVREFVIREIEYNFMGLISEPKTILMMLK